MSIAMQKNSRGNTGWEELYLHRSRIAALLGCQLCYVMSVALLLKLPERRSLQRRHVRSLALQDVLHLMHKILGFGVYLHYPT